MGPTIQGMKRIPVCVPPSDEQAAIVKFFGHANRKIDRYIQAKRKLIKLLEEQKQVIIHRAVTRGLDPNVRMKPSGVDWLGDAGALGSRSQQSPPADSKGPRGLPSYRVPTAVLDEARYPFATSALAREVRPIWAPHKRYGPGTSSSVCLMCRRHREPSACPCMMA